MRDSVDVSRADTFCASSSIARITSDFETKDWLLVRRSTTSYV